MDNELDIIAQFNKDAKDIESSSNKGSKRRDNSESFPWKSYKFWGNENPKRPDGPGTLVTRVIPDSKMKMISVINNAIEFRIPLSTDENGYTDYYLFRWCSNDNYLVLTDEERALNDKVLATYNKFIEVSCDVYGEENVWDNRMSTLALLYVKIWKKTAHTDKGSSAIYNKPNITVLLHKSSSFQRDFVSSIKTRTDAKGDGGKWMKKFFTRELGTSSNNAIISSRLRDNKKGEQPGYEIKFTFDDIHDIELTQEDLEDTESITAEWVDRRAYNKELALQHIQVLEDQIAKLTDLSSKTEKVEQSTPKSAATLDDMELM